MYKDKKVAVVVPAYNEEKLIGKVLVTIPHFVDIIIVVNDASTDSSRDVLERYKIKLGKRLEVIEHKENKGVGAAIVSGYKKALDMSMDVVVVMAGDGQMDPGDLENIIKPVVSGEVDYTKGNRLFTGKSWEMIPHIRYLGNSFLSLLTKIASGYWHIADSQSGYTAISQYALKRLDLDKIYPRYGMPNDMLIWLNIIGAKVKDVEVTPVYNIGEKSYIKLHSVIPKISWILIKGFFRRMLHKYVIRDFHPLVFFYLMGLILTPAGFLFGMYLVFCRVLGTSVAPTSALFACFLFISGLQSLFFAMWFDMEYNKALK